MFRSPAGLSASLSALLAISPASDHTDHMLLLSLSWYTWVEKLASFPNTFLIDDHSETEGIFLNPAVALNRAGVIFHCPDEHWNASFINPPRTYIHTVGFHFFIALLVGLLKSPLSWKWRDQINKTRWDASSQCPGPDEMESRWQSPTGKQI